MAHGAGGRQTSELIDEVFKTHFANPDLTADDAAVLVPPAGKMAVSTDGFIVGTLCDDEAEGRKKGTVSEV